MRALFFGTYDAAAHPRVAVLIEGLRASGLSVTECNAPLGLSTAARVAMLRRPWLLPRLGIRLLRNWLVLIRRARAVRPPDVVVVGYLGHFDVRLARRLFPTTPIVLDHLVGASDTATDRGVGRGLRQRLLRRLDAGALAAADVVLVDTDEHLAALPVTNRGKAVVVPVGAPAAWFADMRPDQAAPPAQPTGPVRVVFFGLFTPLHGAPVIGAALAELAGDPSITVDVTMIGSGQDLAETRRLAAANQHVVWMDWVPADALPGVVADHDICLGIFGTGPKAHRVVPNKVFQGAAAGCAILTSDSPPQRRLLRTAATYVPAGDPAALAAAVRGLAADRDVLHRAKSAAVDLARAEFTPVAVTAPLVDRLRALDQPVQA